MKRVLEMVGGDGCTVTWRYLMLLNGTLTKDEDGKSYFLLYFTPIKKMNNNKATNSISGVFIMHPAPSVFHALFQGLQTSVIPTSPPRFCPCLTLGFSQRRLKVRMCGRWFCCTENQKKRTEFFSFPFLRTKDKEKIKRTVQVWTFLVCFFCCCWFFFLL